MPTPAERKALAFVALVILLGGTVRVVRAGALSPPPADPAEQQALARQAYAASSAAVVQRERKGRSGRKPARDAPRRRDAGARVDSTGVMVEGSGVLSATGFPPPGPRIDVDMRGKPPGGASPAPRPGSAALASGLVDLDVAAVEEIERLPRVGPALARRIVASRDSLGPFGALPALRRVKGIGPAILGRLAPLVTFSGQARR